MLMGDVRNATRAESLAEETQMFAPIQRHADACAVALETLRDRLYSQSNNYPPNFADEFLPDELLKKGCSFFNGVGSAKFG